MKHLESALSKKNEWFGYFAMLTVIPLVAQLLAVIPFIIVRSITSLPAGISESDIELMNPSSYGINSTVGLALLILPFVIMLLAFVMLYKPLHGRGVTSVVNGTKNIRWRRILIGFAVYFIVLLFFLVVDYYLNINKYELRLNWQKLIPLIFVSLLFIPFQAFYEEIIFRGYVAQGIARLTRNRFLVVLIPTILFTLFHSFNPEVEKYGFWAMMPFYFVSGLTYAIISVLDDGIEIAMGMHAANNIFSSIFVVMEGSVFKTDALLYLKELDINAEYLPFLLTHLIIFASIAYKYRWRIKTIVTKVDANDNNISMVHV